MEQGSLLLTYLWTLHGPPPFLWCHRRAVSTSGTLALGNVVLGSPRSQRVKFKSEFQVQVCEALACVQVCCCVRPQQVMQVFLISLQIVMVFMEYFR